MKRSFVRTWNASWEMTATRSAAPPTVLKPGGSSAEGEIDLALLDLNLGTENGIDLLKTLKETDPELLIIIITGYGSVESAVDALKLGAFHYMKKALQGRCVTRYR